MQREAQKTNGLGNITHTPHARARHGQANIAFFHLLGPALSENDGRKARPPVIRLPEAASLSHGGFVSNFGWVRPPSNEYLGRAPISFSRNLFLPVTVSANGNQGQATHIPPPFVQLLCPSRGGR